MTCIVGLVQEGRVHIGGDSLAGDGSFNARSRADVKVFERDGWVFGFTSSFRMGQLLRYSLALPKRHPDRDAFEFMVVDFIGAVRDCLKAGGFASCKENVESGGSFLVGREGRLFAIHDDYQVAESLTGFDACGCGDDIAIGSLFSTTSLGPEERITTALRAASAFSMGVRPPFTLVVTP